MINMEQSELLTNPKNVQIDLFYLNLLGVSLDEMERLVARSPIPGLRHVTRRNIETLIEAETILYGIASVQEPDEQE